MPTLITYLFTISSLGLGFSVIPEIIKISKKPSSVKSFSPLFLLLRVFFFILMVIGLLLKNDNSLFMIMYLQIWYVIYYGILLGLYIKIRYYQTKKNTIS